MRKSVGGSQASVPLGSQHKERLAKGAFSKDVTATSTRAKIPCIERHEVGLLLPEAATLTVVFATLASTRTARHARTASRRRAIVIATPIRILALEAAVPMDPNLPQSMFLLAVARMDNRARSVRKKGTSAVVTPTSALERTHRGRCNVDDYFANPTARLEANLDWLQ